MIGIDLSPVLLVLVLGIYSVLRYFCKASKEEYDAG